MPQVPSGTKFIGISANVDTLERKSTLANSPSQIYTIEDIASSASATWGSITGTLSAQTDLNSALSGKQATLVSGTNIKTINGSSILGSGNLNILQGTNYISVLAQGTPAQNGQAVKDALTIASNMTPNGNPLSNTNRVTILLAPGLYTFNEAVDGQFYIVPLYVDLESISGEPDVFFSSLEVGNFGGFVNTRITGIDTTKNNYYSHGAFAVSSTGSVNESITIKNCVGRDYSFSSFSSGFRGTYENCTARDYSFGSTGDGIVPPAGINGIPGAFSFQNYGTFKNCTARDFSFCTVLTFIGGTTANYGLIDGCTARSYSFCYGVAQNSVQNTGTITRCTVTASSGYSFCCIDSGSTGNSAINNGIISNCSSGNVSFCVNTGMYSITTRAVNNGTIIECSANGDFSFCVAFSVIPGDSLGQNSGIIYNCNAYNGINCFVGNLGNNSGIITNCIATGRAFCCDNSTGIIDDICRCTMLNDAFTVGATGGGRVVLGIDNTGVVNY